MTIPVVDKIYNCLQVGKSGKEYAQGIRTPAQRFNEKRVAVHDGHTLVGKEHRDKITFREYFSYQRK
ncbi:MAG: hypothetical protein GX874_11585, partial [Smithella sp.]|nr:hypothetical protein [Smithella sp.]